MNQGRLFDNRQHLERVKSRIGLLVLEFCRKHRTFRMENLRNFISSETSGHVAPASPDRILRQLRREGFLDYRVLSRKESLYRVEEVR